MGFNSILAKTVGEEFNALHFAVGGGYLETCRALADGCTIEEREELLNHPDIDGMTVLHFACKYSFVPIISWLLSEEKGGGRSTEGKFESVLAKTTEEGATALHLAAQGGSLNACQALVRGCKVEDGERAELLQAVDQVGRTVLHSAAAKNHPSIITWLLSDKEDGGRAVGFNGLLSKAAGNTALHLATHIGHLEVCRAVLEGCIDDNERDQLLNATDNQEWTVLHIVATADRESILVWLLRKREEGGAGIDLDSIFAVTNIKQSVLHLCARRGFTKCFDVFLDACQTSAERFRLFCGVDYQRRTILHHAARCCGNGPLFITHVLNHYPIEAKLIVDSRDNEGMTALHTAVILKLNRGWLASTVLRRETSRAEIVRALLGSGAKTTTTSSAAATTTEQVVVADPNIGMKLQ